MITISISSFTFAREIQIVMIVSDILLASNRDSNKVVRFLDKKYTEETSAKRSRRINTKHKKVRNQQNNTQLMKMILAVLIMLSIDLKLHPRYLLLAELILLLSHLINGFLLAVSLSIYLDLQVSQDTGSIYIHKVSYVDIQLILNST